MVLKTATYVAYAELTATSEVVDTGEVMVFLGAHHVITVRHGAHNPLKDLRQQLERQRELLCLGPSAVLYAVADRLAQPEGSWRRFRAPSALRPLYPIPHAWQPMDHE